MMDGYKVEGRLMWRVDVGKKMRGGGDYTELMVYDVEGEGKGEIGMKRAEGRVDGSGGMMGDEGGD